MKIIYITFKKTYGMTKKDIVSSLHIPGGRRGSRGSPLVYGCNIDFIQLIGEENYILNYPDASARCQWQELLGPRNERGCRAAGAVGELRGPNCSSAETSDLQSAASAPNNKVTQTPLMKPPPR